MLSIVSIVLHASMFVFHYSLLVGWLRSQRRAAGSTNAGGAVLLR
jgi:hypothetical protein